MPTKNDIQQGYKQIGLSSIPADWDVKELKDVCNKITDGTHDTPIPQKNGIPFLTALHVKEGMIDFDGCYFLPIETHKEIYKRCNPEKNDVLMVNIGAGVATTALVNVDYEFSLKNVALLKPNINKLIGPYLNHYQIFIKPKLTQTLLNGGAQPFLSLKQIQKLKILLPPILEQRAIDQLLYTWDEAITKAQALIIQKELRKKWLMRQLLTEMKRLKGFKGEWKKIDFNDCFEFIKSYSISRDGLTTSMLDDSIYCIHYGDIHALYEGEFLDFVNQLQIPIIENKITPSEADFLKDGDIIMADASEDYEGVGEAVEVKNIGNRRAVGGLHTIVLRGNKKSTSDKFRAYLFASEFVRNELRKKATGTSVYSVTKSTLESLVFNVPSLEEQTAIANILWKTDKEIALIKQKLEKLKEQKKGLMQVLLTGKKRLKVKNDGN